MDDLNELRIFVKVAETGNFAEAARAMGVTTSSASKAVRRLEDKLGAKLLTRSTRAVSQTGEGARFLVGARRLLEDAEALRDELAESASEPRGKLVISAPEAFGRMWMTERVIEFMRRHTQVDVELMFEDRFADLINERVDIAIRVGNLGNSPNLVTRKFFEDEIHTCASPAYIEAFGEPARPADLRAHRAVHYRNRNTGRLLAYQFLEAGEVTTIEFEPTLVTNSIYSLEHACQAGIGIVQLPGIVAQRAFANGELVEILKDHRTGKLQYSLIYAERRHLPARVKAFADFLVAEPPSLPDFLK